MSWVCSECGGKGAADLEPVFDARYTRGRCASAAKCGRVDLIREDSFDRDRWKVQKAEERRRWLLHKMSRGSRLSVKEERELRGV